MLILMPESVSTFALFYQQLKGPHHFRIFAVLMVYCIQLFMQPASHMVYWKMTVNGDCAFRMLLIWPVVINCASSLSPSCVIVHHQILWRYGQNSESTYVMTFTMLFMPETSSRIQLKIKCLTMASTSSIVFCKLETSHLEIGQQCLFHNLTGLKQLATD